MSHHISGPRALAVPEADITDMYAFPSPERPGQLSLVLNVVPFASPNAVFSDAITYRFRVRPIGATANGETPFAAGAEEITFDCSFSLRSMAWRTEAAPSVRRAPTSLSPRRTRVSASRKRCLD